MKQHRSIVVIALAAALCAVSGKVFDFKIPRFLQELVISN
jgi:uncharacterized membrane protein